MKTSVTALTGLCLFFVASAFGAEQRPPQQQAAAASSVGTPQSPQGAGGPPRPGLAGSGGGAGGSAVLPSSAKTTCVHGSADVKGKPTSGVDDDCDGVAATRPGAAPACAQGRTSAAGKRAGDDRDCDDSDESVAPQAVQHLHPEKIVHRDLAARGAVPTVAPSANPQPGVAPLSVGKSAGCKKGTATVKGHVDQDCDSDNDRVASQAVSNAGVKRACNSSDPNAACGDRR